ncbi:MAG: hypothetical protein HY825_13840 [Acidobacteria bacterium]|nr:hypothetical protein [Acidobacteriota bacterium]
MPVRWHTDVPARADPHVALWIEEGAPEGLLEAATEFPLVVDVRVPRDGIVPSRTLDLLRGRRNIEAVVLVVDLCMIQSSDAVLEVGAALGRVARTLEAVRPEIEVGVAPRRHPRDCPSMHPKGPPGLCDSRLLGIGPVVEEAARRANGRLPFDAILSSCAEDWPSGATGLASMGTNWRGDPRNPDRWSSFSFAFALPRLLNPDPGGYPCSGVVLLRRDYKSLLPPLPPSTSAPAPKKRPFGGRVFVDVGSPRSFYPAAAWFSRLLDTTDVTFGEEPWVQWVFVGGLTIQEPMIRVLRIAEGVPLLALWPRHADAPEFEITYETGERFRAALLVELETGREAMIEVPTTPNCLSLSVPAGIRPDLAVLLP